VNATAETAFIDLPAESPELESPPVVFESAVDPVVTIVVLGWGSAPHLLDCLRSVSRIDRSVTFEVVVTLNEPTAELVTVLAEYVQGARIIQSRVNLGFGGACNAAAEIARGRYIVLLNDDTFVDRFWLAPLVETIEARSEISAVGSMFLNLDGTLQESGSMLFADGSTKAAGDGGPGMAHRYDWARRVDYCSAASLLIRKSTWDRLGGFDEIYFPAYFEDVDLCLRIQEIGQEVWLQPLSRVRHVRSASIAGSYKAFLTLRNRRRLVQRWSHVLAQRPGFVNDVGIEELSMWIGMGRPNRVLVIDDRIPASWLGSGFGRMVDALNDLTSSGRNFVSLFPSASGKGSRNELCRMGVRILEGNLEEHLRQEHTNYDVVMISRPHNYEKFGHLVRTYQPRAAVVYDAEALYFRRVEGLALLSEDPAEHERLRAEATAMQEAERAYFADADQAICISDSEAAYVRTIDGAGPVHVIQAKLASPEFTTRPFAQRRDVVLVAGWLSGASSPNGDGLTWFIQEVLPLVRAHIPWVRLRVTGGSPPPELLRYANPNVVFEGRVRDLHSFYDESRVAIVPIRFGAGVKLKAIEALQYGVPTVATAVGSEGIRTYETGALLVTDDPVQFALHVATLADNPQVWEEQRKRISDLHAIWAEEPKGASWQFVLERALADRVSERQPR
jgi:GT2 family glycosyltransferase/glycosyltransferase involved in cell wall biosynthesis